ncbi:hypothetical protein [Streptomyces fagopyri]|uniref:hypothetical protein n=1 Tax=Streptomyces fagopyri TaxID=2662397 RepID=UPI00382A6D0F
MDSLTPPAPTIPIEPASPPALPEGPVCTQCAAPALVNWRRRLTDTELADHLALERERRAEARLLADPQRTPPPDLPLPTAQELTRIVYACGAHAISLEAAAHIHASACTAPNEADLPGCDCTPEVAPKEPLDVVPELPAHWIPGGP